MMSQVLESGEPIVNTSDSGGTFVLLERLGRGGFADVYRAERTTREGLRNIVAVKLLRTDLPPRVKAEARLQREAEIQFGMNHPVICRALHLVVLDGHPGLVTEYIEGRDLRECFRDGIPMGPLLEVIQRVALALSYAFKQHGVVHRDVTPSNVRIGRHDGSVKLLDFGIAWSELTEERYTIEGHIAGVLQALAPERLLSLEATPAPAGDVFSLGCVLYRGLHDDDMLNLSKEEVFALYPDPQETEAFIAQRLDALPPGVPKGVRQLLRDMLRWNPVERLTADEVAEQCRVLLEGMEGQPTLINWNERYAAEGSVDSLRYTTTHIAAVRRRRRRSVVAVAGVVGLFSLAWATVWWLWPREPLVLPTITGVSGPTGRARMWCPSEVTNPDPVHPSCVYLLEQRVGNDVLWVQDSELTGIQWRALGCNPLEVPDNPSLPVEVSFESALACLDATPVARARANLLMSAGQWRAMASPTGAPPWPKPDDAGRWAVIAIDETNRPSLSMPRRVDDEGDNRYRWRAPQGGLFDLWGNVAEWSSEGRLLGGSRLDEAEDVLGVRETRSDDIGGLRLVVTPEDLTDEVETLTSAIVLPVQWAAQASVLEFSELLRWEDRILAVPQFDVDDFSPEQLRELSGYTNCGGWAIHSFSVTDIERAVRQLRNGQPGPPLAPTLIPVEWHGKGASGTCVPPAELAGVVNWRSEGIEAAHVAAPDASGASDAWVLGEARVSSGRDAPMTSCLYSGRLLPTRWGHVLKVELTNHTCRNADWTQPDKRSPGVRNSAAEALVVFSSRILEIPEMLSGGSLTEDGQPAPRVRVTSTAPPISNDVVAAPSIPWRVTDATEPDDQGRFWVTNYAWVGDQKPSVYGWHCQTPPPPVRGQERLVELQIGPDASLALTGRWIPLAPSGEGRNWEGIARLTVDGEPGLLLVTDEFPDNLLAWVSEQEARDGFEPCPTELLPI